MLRDADLRHIRDDFWAVLSAAPGEVDGLRRAIIDGLIDGSTYTGECACLVGTIQKLRKCEHGSIAFLRPDSSRPIERFFMGIKRGDTPETNPISKLAMEWADIWLANMRAAFGPAE